MIVNKKAVQAVSTFHHLDHFLKGFSWIMSIKFLLYFRECNSSLFQVFWQVYRLLNLQLILYNESFYWFLHCLLNMKVIYLIINKVHHLISNCFGLCTLWSYYNCFSYKSAVLAEWKPPVYDNTKGITLVTATTRRNSPNVRPWCTILNY